MTIFATKEMQMRPIHLLALLPAAGVLIGPFFLNRVTPFILGMPFLLGWLAFMLVLTSIVMAIIFHSDSKTHADCGVSGKELA